MRFIGKTNIKFIEKRKIWYFISLTLILVGLLSLFLRGIPLGIDFLGGTEVIVRFEKPVARTASINAMFKTSARSATIPPVE